MTKTLDEQKKKKKHKQKHSSLFQNYNIVQIQTLF